jgi:hypothetical protein
VGGKFFKLWYLMSVLLCIGRMESDSAHRGGGGAVGGGGGGGARKEGGYELP